MEGAPKFESNLEEEPIKISKEEWEKYANLPVDDSKLSQWMTEKGIVFDSGNIEIEIDGEKKEMNTDKEDFGTLLLDESDEIIDSELERKEA